MISVKNLNIEFAGKVILNNITFNVEKGETVVILGKNGSGKTVLLKAIAGLISNYSGTIHIAENNARDLKKSKYSGISLSYVFQKGGLFDSMSVFDNVAFTLRRLGKGEDEIKEIVVNSLRRLGLSGNEEKSPSELSGGMQKRVGIARAICSDPDILLYDDPTAGLDPVLSDSISNIILDIKHASKNTSIVITHDLETAKKVADNIGLIYKGNIVFWGSNAEFFNRGNEYTDQFIKGNLEGPIEIY